jgi:hypothetical protein
VIIKSSNKKNENQNPAERRALKCLSHFNLMRTTLPIFSGNITDYYVNYLVELDIFARIDPKGAGVFVGTSPKNEGPQILPYSH